MRRLAALVLAAACAGGLAATSGPSPPGRRLASLPASSGTRPARAQRPVAELFTPDDPLASQQWYLARTRALDAWPDLPPLEPVRVAVIDSGIDLGHPDLAARVVAARSFVPESVKDVQGHGTIVAGIIAAETGNAVGISGLAPAADLVIAKVVARDRSISVRSEAEAIRWAVGQGARVINMSLGGLRDPTSPRRDTYSSVEAEAIRYAVHRGVLVVAAVGNGDQAPRQPWPFATYPAALEHVLGVSATNRGGAVPAFSNRDRIYNDIAAPGVDILSTFPRSLTAALPGCVEQGYTLCAPDEFASPEGTSFSAPQVTAIAANLLSVDPSLQPDQLSAIIEHTAVDATPATGCAACPGGRDALTGWGNVDGAAAVAALDEPLPTPDRLEPNDDAGPEAARLYFRNSTGTRGVRATLDFWDDRDDVLAVYLKRGQRLFASLVAPGAETALAVWVPGTLSVDDLTRQDRRVRASATPGAVERVSWTASRAGWHYVQLRVTAPASTVPYRLSVVKAAPRR